MLNYIRGAASVEAPLILIYRGEERRRGGGGWSATEPVCDRTYNYFFPVPRCVPSDNNCSGDSSGSRRLERAAQQRATYLRATLYTGQHCVRVTYIRNCGEREAVCATLIPLILRRHACCSCLSEMRHRRRRSSRNKKALRGCMHRVCMHSVAPTHTRTEPEQRLCARFVIGCLESFFRQSDFFFSFFSFFSFSRIR